MSIENEIKKLRESIEGLTNAIIESKKPVITEKEGNVIVEKSYYEVLTKAYFNKTKNRIDPEPTPVKIETKLEKEIKDAEKEGKEIAKIIKERKKEVEVPNAKLEYNLNKSKENSKITNDMVKQLGKEKMAAGVDRSKIKSIITSLAGLDASIADLDESNIEECYNKISELQPESK